MGRVKEAVPYLEKGKVSGELWRALVEAIMKGDFHESITIRAEGEETYFYTIPIRRRYRPEG